MSQSVRANTPRALHPASSEEGRAFLQERLVLFFKTSFWLSTFFLVGSNVLGWAVNMMNLYQPSDPSNLWHLAATLGLLGAWLVVRNPRRRYRYTTLVAFDVGTILFALTDYGLMSAMAPLRFLGTTGFDLALVRIPLFNMMVTLLVLMLRAVIVPSSMRHTTLVSAVGVVPAMIISYWIFSRFQVGDPPQGPGPAVASSGLWALATVMVAAVTSRVIYGLRAQVAAAQHLGQYLLEHKVGEGGMGIVYRASHALLRRPTAVKLLPPDRAGAETVSRFEREVQLTSSLSHPNTVAIFDYGHTPDGIFYYAMEYLDGIDLEELVERHGSQPPSRVVHLLVQICGSLSEAHGVGLVHRDIKPANIILCERGGVPDIAKVVDFGLVKSVSVGDPKVTTGDTVVGTPLYMAPEAIADPDGVDARADLYALGAVGYFLLAGKPVFEGGSVIEVCAKHLHEAPPSLDEAAEQPVPPALAALLMRCLGKRPDERPPSAAAMRDELLACGVEPWSEAEARAWWKAYRATPKAARDKRRSDSPSALTIDLASRLPHDQRVAG